MGEHQGSAKWEWPPISEWEAGAVLRILFCLTWNLSIGQLDLEETGLSWEAAGRNTEKGESACACGQGIKSVNANTLSLIHI